MHANPYLHANSLLVELLNAIEDDEHQEAIALLAELMDWIKRGGEKPNTQAAVETLLERMKDEEESS